ncbi:hypothetical protein ACFWXH_08430 [Mesorhizobium sp. NPDC059054]|uniref:hypothetical protein n=1 Tax=unclassified Mesorhizobium TaxID=325217 RepID=UPI0006C763F8|nr:hypothetical protein [Mesorhizobium sp. 1M-11]
MSRDMVLMTIACPEGTPGLDRAAELLGVPTAEMDRSFGVVVLDPQKGLYAVQVHETAIKERPTADTGGQVKGPFSNPRIEPFGPTRK